MNQVGPIVWQSSEVEILARAAVIAVIAASSIAGGCGSSSPPPAPSCPNDTPDSCPSPMPSYATDVAPILQNRCVPCHGPGGVEAVRPFDTYANITRTSDNPNRMLTQIHACLMPPADQPQLTADERKIILGWIVCNTPDN
jgi:uncharacterized membrane protein